MNKFKKLARERAWQRRNERVDQSRADYVKELREALQDAHADEIELELKHVGLSEDAVADGRPWTVERALAALLQLTEVKTWH
jgi:hypothetical protein